MKTLKIVGIILLGCFYFGSCDDAKATPASSLSEFITIQNLNILSRIQARFATTSISSRIKNAAKQATEVIFIAQIPDEAFISNFSMQIDDKLIYGNVKEKQEAEQTFEAAKSRGESAGLVAKKPRESNIFQINVNVAAESKVTFNVTYQEILQRVHGVYKHVVDAQTNYPVNAVYIEIEIHERGEITDLKVPRFEEKISEKTNKELLTYASEKDAIIERSSNGSESSVTVKFSPQTKNQIFAGQLAVLYDVKRDAGGSIEIVDGYFVHFFAPEGLPKGNKKIVFVLDRSGSMLGHKFEQLQQSMKVMLNDLDPGDTFNIIFFSTDSSLWKPESLRATPENVKAAQTYVADNSASGSTDIFGSLKLALKTLDGSTKKGDTLASMILFLTDGQPTEGVIDGSVITKNVTDLNGGKYLIHCIGFGEDADMLLMQKISSKNRGLAKKVFEDSDAALQLTGFFDEISNPLLSQVKIKYLNDTVDVGSIVRNDDSSDYFDGGEVITIGKVKDAQKSQSIQADVTAIGSSGPRSFRSTSVSWMCPLRGRGWGCCPRPYAIPVDDRPLIWPPSCCWGCPPPWPPGPPVTTPAPKAPLPANTLGGFVERMWAYKTIKKLMKDAELGDSGKDASKKKALGLSLKYGFVTDLTSMVVVQQQSPIPIVLFKAAVEAGQASQNSGGGAGGFNFLAPIGGTVANGRASSVFASGSLLGIAGPIGPESIQASKPHTGSGTGLGSASASSGTGISGEAQKQGTKDSCGLQVVTILDTEVDKSPNGRITSAMASNIVQRVVVDHPSSSTGKIVHPLSSTNSTVKRNLTTEISAQLGQTASTKNYVVIFAPYGALNEKLAGQVKSLKNTTILVVVLEQYSKDRLSKLNDLAGDSRNVLVNPSLDDVLKKIAC